MMKRSRRFVVGVFVVAVAGFLVGADEAENKSSAKDIRTDREKLQGTWKVTAKGKTFVIPIGEKRFGTKLIYTLRSNKKIKEIDFRHGGANDHPRVTTTGIYKLEKDTLTVCWVFKGPRPTEFKDNPKAGQYLLTLIRTQPDGAK